MWAFYRRIFGSPGPALWRALVWGMTVIGALAIGFILLGNPRNIGTGLLNYEGHTAWLVVVAAVVFLVAVLLRGAYLNHVETEARLTRDAELARAERDGFQKALQAQAETHAETVKAIALQPKKAAELQYERKKVVDFLTEASVLFDHLPDPIQDDHDAFIWGANAKSTVKDAREWVERSSLPGSMKLRLTYNKEKSTRKLDRTWPEEFQNQYVALAVLELGLLKITKALGPGDGG